VEDKLNIVAHFRGHIGGIEDERRRAVFSSTNVNGNVGGATEKSDREKSEDSRGEHGSKSEQSPGRVENLGTRTTRSRIRSWPAGERNNVEI